MKGEIDYHLLFELNSIDSRMAIIGEQAFEYRITLGDSGGVRSPRPSNGRVIPTRGDVLVITNLLKKTNR